MRTGAGVPDGDARSEHYALWMLRYARGPAAPRPSSGRWETVKWHRGLDKTTGRPAHPGLAWRYRGSRRSDFETDMDERTSR